MVMNIQWYGCRRDMRDPRDKIFKPKGIRLPATVDLRKDCPPIMDQGELGSCTAHAITGALRYEKIRSGEEDIRFSRLQLYYDERAMEGTTRSDAGAEIRDGIKCASKIGIAHESLWAYNISHFDNKPPEKVYRDAHRFRALKYQRVQVDTLAVKKALALRHPVVIGITLFESFESDAVSRTGIVPLPRAKEQVVGGHAMYVVGYGQHAGHFTVRNSWNTDWGDHGDCYIPEGYIGSNKFGADYWIVTEEGS